MALFRIRFLGLTKTKDSITRKGVKVGTVIKLFRKYFKHGEPGSAITKDHEVVYPGLKMRVYGVEQATVEYLDAEMKSKVLRCRTDDGQHFNVVCKIDTY